MSGAPGTTYSVPLIPTSGPQISIAPNATVVPSQRGGDADASAAATAAEAARQGLIPASDASAAASAAAAALQALTPAPDASAAASAAAAARQTLIPAPDASAAASAAEAALQALIPAPDASAAASAAAAAAPPSLGLDPSAASAASAPSGPPADLDPEEVILNTYALLQKISQQIDGIVSRDSSALQEYIGNKVFDLDIKIDNLARMVAGVPAGAPTSTQNQSLDTKIDGLTTLVASIPAGTSSGYGEGQTGGGKRRGTQKKRK